MYQILNTGDNGNTIDNMLTDIHEDRDNSADKESSVDEMDSKSLGFAKVAEINEIPPSTGGGLRACKMKTSTRSEAKIPEI